jgi:hypothetical protein
MSGRGLLAVSRLSAALATLVLAPGTASAELPLGARDTAHVLPEWEWRAGIFAPVAVGVGHGVELTTSLAPWFLASPNVAVRVELGTAGPVTLTGEYGLSVPTGSMYVLQGYLFPSFKNGDGQIGWSLVPTFGLFASAGKRTENVLTGRLETAIGIPLGETSLTPLDTYAPIELIYAPALTGYRARLGGMYDHAFFSWMRGRVGVTGYMVGKSPYPPRSPFYASAEAAVELALGGRVRLSLGAIYYNYDQRDRKQEQGDDGKRRWVSVRSNDLYPTVDLIVGSR